jgi:hypothetical protein
MGGEGWRLETGLQAQVAYSIITINEGWSLIISNEEARASYSIITINEGLSLIIIDEDAQASYFFITLMKAQASSLKPQASLL